MALTTWRPLGAYQSVLSAPYDDVGWSGSYVQLQNDDEATGGVTLTFPGSYSHILRAYSFGFVNEIPAGATVNGVLFRSNQFCVNGPSAARSSFYQLCYNSAAIGSQKGVNVNLAQPTTSMVNHGGSTDLWGYAVTRAIVVDPSFGIQMAFNAITGSPSIFIDSLQLQIDYTEGASNGGQNGRFTNHLRQQKGSISGFIGGR